MEPANLKPTNYCTAMWNGVRCDGTHDQEWGRGDVVHSVRGEGDQWGSMWRDGYGGIVLNERPYIEDPDIDLGWSALEHMHAEACDGEGPIVRMSKSRAIVGPTGTFLDGAHAGQLAGIGTWGLLGTFETNVDWTQWEMSTGMIDPTGPYAHPEVFTPTDNQVIDG